MERRSSLQFATLAALALPLALASCDKTSATPAKSSSGPESGAGDPFGPGGACDMRALMARPENGCTNAGCHGERFQGNLDLLSPGIEQRLVGVAGDDACSGALLVDAKTPDDSLLLKLIDPKRFTASPCGVMMPFGSQSGVSAEDLSCFEGWVASIAKNASDDGVAQSPAFEAVDATSYVNKVKLLLTGGAATSDEVAAVRADPSALRDQIKAYLATPEFEQKLADFLRVALQQKLIGTFDSQFQRLRGNQTQLTAFKADMQEAFVRTASDIVLSGRPFTDVLTTQHWAATTATLAALAYLDRTETELKQEKHTVVREPTADMPAAPLPLAYSVENHVWQVASLPTTCDVGTLNADTLFELLLGFVPCKGPGAKPYRFDDSVLTPADFEDWRFVDIESARNAEAVPVFYDLDTLRGAKRIALEQPRIGFFTTPAFLANWETNPDNQFRVTTSQTIITALGEIFSPADSTEPARLDGLAKDHAAPGTTCYGCHQFLDPMREYFAQSFSFDFQRPETPSDVTPSFAFQHYVHDGGNLADFAAALADHPDFAAGWTQKLCYWANSTPCDPKDPEFLRVASAFQNSHFDLETLLVELLSSPLVTGATETQSFRTSPPLLSITRKQHLCQLLDARLGTSDTCSVAANFANLVPEDEFSRGAAEPVQTAVTGLFHYAAIEKLCARLATKLVGTTSDALFAPQTPEPALDAFVERLMGLDAGHPRHDAARQALEAHFEQAKVATNTTTALRSAFIVACTSPEVQALGL